MFQSIDIEDKITYTSNNFYVFLKSNKKEKETCLGEERRQLRDRARGVTRPKDWCLIPSAGVSK